MSDPVVSTVVHVCEDTNQTFNIQALLAQAGYITTEPVIVLGIEVENPDSTVVEAPTPLFTQVDDQTVAVTAANLANYNGEFNTLTVLLADGFTFVTLNLRVVVDPVNDAPSGTDASITLVDGSPYVLGTSSFGFSDALDGHSLKSVVISSLPTSGTLMFNGTALSAPTEISAADIAAGKLSFQPTAGGASQASFGFQVRDDGGLEGCNAADLDATANTLTFNIPTASIGNRVWKDSDCDGLQDSCETGVAGVQVTLLGAGTDGLFGTSDDTTATTVTNSNGNYLFNNLAAGQYQVQFGALRAGYAYTRQDAGSNDACDSDANSMGRTGTITLAAGETNTTVDAGIKCVPLGCIGNRVWKDSDADGQQDWFESGVSGVKVTLLGAGWDGQFGTADDTTAWTTTNWLGNYNFDNLAAGQYVVHVGNLPSGYVLTGQDRGYNDACDSDVNSLGLSNVIHLGVGQSNQNIDVGIVKTASSSCWPSLSDLLCVDNLLDCYFGSQPSSNDACSTPTSHSYNTCDEELRRLTAC